MSESHWRLFVSISVPDAIKHEIERLQFEMRRIVAPDCVRWTGDQLHLTLRFLGNVATNKVEDLTHKVQKRISQTGIGSTAKQTVSSMVERGKNVASIGRKRVHESMEAARQKLNESIEEEDDLSER